MSSRTPPLISTKNSLKLVVGIYVIAAFLSVCKLKCEIFSRGMQQVLFCWLAFDVDFGCFVLQPQI